MSTRSYASLVEPVRVAPADTTVSVLITSTTVLAENLKRKLLILRNLDAANPVFISFDADAADTDDFELPAKGAIVLDVVVPTSQIRAIATGGTVKLFVSEG